MKEYDNYIVFLLIGDNFKLSRKLRAKSIELGMDEIYELCIEIAKKFEKSEHNLNLEIGQYEALERFLEENEEFIIIGGD